MASPSDFHHYQALTLAETDPLPHLALVILDDCTEASEFTVRSERSELQEKIDKLHQVILGNKDAIVHSIKQKLLSMIKEDPCLQREIQTLFEKSKEVDLDTFLERMHSHFILEFNHFDRDFEEFELVDPYPNLREILEQYYQVNNLSSFKQLEEKIDLEAITRDINSGGSSTLYYIGKGIWLSGKVLYQLFRILSFTANLITYTPSSIRIVAIASRLIIG